MLKWRAIFVIPVTSLDMNSSILANVEGERLFDSKNGVHVTLKCDKKFMKIREKSIFNVSKNIRITHLLSMFELNFFICFNLQAGMY